MNFNCSQFFPSEKERWDTATEMNAVSKLTRAKIMTDWQIRGNCMLML